MKSAILLSLIASAAAFAPAQNAVKTSVATNMAFDDELGVQAPLGMWDPCGFLSDGDQERFERYRYVELKHGRISMLAVVGYLIGNSHVRLPGAIDKAGDTFADIPGGFAGLEALPQEGFYQVVFFIGVLEAAFMKDLGGGEFIGDFRNGFIDFGWDKFDDATKLEKRAIELNNGRAAMMGILALMVHEKLGNPLVPSVW